MLTGKGTVDIPTKFSKNIIDVYLSRDELDDAYSASTILCLPSINESFSRVIMESWTNKTPVLVNEKCNVTKNFCIESNGGLYFNNYSNFESCLNYFLNNPDMAKKLGENGFNYVKKNYEWNTIVNSYVDFFQTIKN